MQNPIMMPNNHPIPIELAAVDHILKIIRQVPMPATESFPLIRHIEEQRQVAVDQFIDAQNKPTVSTVDCSQPRTHNDIVKDVIDEVCSVLMTADAFATADEKRTRDHCVTIINQVHRTLIFPSPSVPPAVPSPAAT